MPIGASVAPKDSMDSGNGPRPAPLREAPAPLAGLLDELGLDLRTAPRPTAGFPQLLKGLRQICELAHMNADLPPFGRLPDLLHCKISVILFNRRP
jgi:hypothetical protein